jgi:hypothetical protein
MPIPKPRKNEKKDEYISRCIEFLAGEGKAQDQAAAICIKEWKESKKEVGRGLEN